MLLKDRDPFVILLIDGEGSMFSDDLIKKGAQGGREGAQLLSCAANEFVAQTLPHLNNPKVLVRIYANVRGTAEALCKTGVIDKPALFDDFIRAFNSSKVLFDFVDAGGRKDAVADKLGELLKLYLYDCHCKCHPSNYVWRPSFPSNCCFKCLFFGVVSEFRATSTSLESGTRPDPAFTASS